MQFLKILFWCLLAFVAALFTYGNWEPVTIHLWSGLEALVNLPLLLFVTFLIGFLPTQIYHAALRWRLRQRLGQAEATLASTRALVVAAPPPAPVYTAAETTPPPLPGELS
ncbi:hypothetical protein [Sphingomonas bacterium]|uniref:hypothetical protein n=1 Tax=Sphingomonas bacterium TaxID=1895847 RepID=UPI00157603AB|nr:hypothetical protein [Sphingomonas bacterium]